MTIHDFPLLSRVRVKSTGREFYVTGYDRDSSGNSEIIVSTFDFSWSTLKSKKEQLYYKPEELEII